MSLVHNRRYLFIGIILLIFIVLIGVVAYQRMATSPVARGYCNDYGCTNFRDGSNWAIRNCQGDSAAGNTYTCSEKGKTGSCGTKSYCCPGPGMLWTTDMSLCQQSQQNSDCCACPSPTPVMLTSACNGPCMNSGNCAGGNICIFDQGYGWVCRNPACWKTTGCACASVTATPSPTPYQTYGTYRCGELCVSSSECQSDLRCLSVGNTRLCRDPECPDTNTCVCIQ